LEANGDDYNVYVPYGNVMRRLGRAKTEAYIALRMRMMGVLEKQLETVPEDVRARILLANVYAEFNRGDDAIRQVGTAVALRPGDANVLYNAACCYAMLGRKPEAMETLQKAFDAGYGNREWVSRDPDFATLKDDPEFQRLCQPR